MGCGSSTFTPNEKIPGQGNEVLATMGTLHYSKKDVDTLWQYFKKRLTTENPHEVSISDLTCIDDAESSTIGELLFRLFSKGHKGSINFSQFITASYHILTLNEPRDVACLMFRILDIENTGMLTLEEAKFMVHLLDDFTLHSEASKMACFSLDKKFKAENESSPVPLEDFLSILQGHMDVMQRFVKFQQILTGKKTVSRSTKPILDKAAWIRLSAERQVIFNGRPFNQVIGVNINSLQLLSFLPSILKGFHFPIAIPIATKFFPMEKSHGVHNLNKAQVSFKEGASLNRHATHNTSAKGQADARGFKEDWMKDSNSKEQEIHDLKARISDKQHSHGGKNPSSRVHAGN